MRSVARFACAAVAALLAGACGDRPSRSDAGAGGDSSSVLPGPSIVPVPSALAAACIAGDASQGEPHTLVGVALPALATVTIESLAPRDSARLAARITRMVDVLPSDTTRADFRGLPVFVRAAWVLAPAAGDSLVVALAARRMPIESDPLEEIFFVVSGPGDQRGLRGALIDAWVAREVGVEDELALRELAAAWQDGDARVLAMVHEGPEGAIVEVIERRAEKWTTAWSGPLPACRQP